MKTLISAMLFVGVLIPLYIIRRIFNVSRFSRRFHQQQSGWDRATGSGGE